jgi:hypothetical protein
MPSLRTRSRAFLNLHRKRLNHYLRQEKLDKECLFDAHISLHIILEVGIHGLFDVIFEKYNAQVSSEEVKFIHELNDKVSIIDKLRQFIGTHSFPGYVENESDQYLNDKKIFKKIANFNDIRNKIIYGARVESFKYDDLVVDFSSNANTGFFDQIREFNEIIESLNRLITFSDVPYSENIIINMYSLGLEKIEK